MEDQACIKTQLKPYIDAIIIEENLQNTSYVVTPGSKVGDNYVGVIHRVVLKGERSDGKPITKSLIYKCQPDNEERRNQFRTEDFFQNEALFYNKVLPSFLQFLEEKDLKNDFQSFPKQCYFAGNALMLEDMCSYGFTMQDRKNTLDLAHCRLVLKEMGKLHAISFALRDQRPEEFKSLTKSMKELIFREGDPILRIHCEASAGKAIKNFMNTSRLENKEFYKKVLDKFQVEYMDSLAEIVNGSNAEPYTVIAHGDCWTNNLLFKYSEVLTQRDSPTPEELCMIDFQITRYASPITDIAYFLYCCTGQDLRDKHCDYLMNEYYQSFAQFLTQLGSNPEELFPFSVFQDQLQRFSKFGLGMALITIPLFTCEAEDLPDFNDLKEGDDPTKLMEFKSTNEDACILRMNDVLVEMVDKKYIE